MDTPSALDLYTTDDLVAELKRRFESVVFAAMKAHDANDRYQHWEYQGDVDLCASLTTRLLHRINVDRDEMERKIDAE